MTTPETFIDKTLPFEDYLAVFDKGVYTTGKTPDEALKPTKANLSKRQGLWWTLFDFSPLAPLAILFALFLLGKATILYIIIAVVLTVILWVVTGKYASQPLLTMTVYDHEGNAQQRPYPLDDTHIVTVPYPSDIATAILARDKNGAPLTQEEGAAIETFERLRGRDDLTEDEQGELEGAISLVAPILEGN